MKTKPGRLWRFSFCLIALLIPVGTARRVYAVSTTTVQDVVYRADGQPAAGTLVISWPAFTTGDNFAVAAGSLSVTIGPQGAISIPLVPNVGGTPDGTYYKVMYKLNDGSTSQEYWLVPATGTATIAAIRSKIVPAGVAMQMVSRQYVDSAIASVVKQCMAANAQTCIDSLASTGGTVYLAPTTYTGPITLPDSGKCVNLVGSGIDVTVLTVSAPATAVVYKGNSSLPVGCRISDLTIDGNLQAAYGLQLLMGKGWVIERVKLRNIAPDTGEGIVLGESAVSSAEFYEARIRDISVAYESGSYAPAHRPLNGIHFLQSASDNKISQITAWNMTNAGIVDDAGDNQYIQVHVYGFPLLTYYPNYAMEITGNAHITQLTSDGVTLGGVHVRGNGNSVTGSTFQWPTPGGQVSGAFPIVAAAGTDFNVYRDNVVRNGLGLAISGLNPVFANIGSSYYPGNNTEIAGNVNYGDSTDGGTFVAFYPIGQAVWGAGTPHGGMTLMTPYTGQPTLTLRAKPSQTADFFDLYANDNTTLLAKIDVNGNATFASVNGGGGGAQISGTPSSPQQAIFTDSTHIAGQSKPYLDVRDFASGACTDAGLHAALAAAANQSSVPEVTVDARACPTMTINSEIDVGGGAANPPFYGTASLLVPHAGQWTATFNSPSSYVLKVFDGSSVIGDGDGISNPFVIQVGTGANVDTVCGSNPGAFGYVRMEGFSCQATTNAIVHTAVLQVQKLFDVSSVSKMVAVNQSSVGTKELYVHDICCSATVDLVNGSGGGLAGNAPCVFDSSNSVGGLIRNVSCVGAGSGISEVQLLQGTTNPGMSIRDVHIEKAPGSTDLTTPALSVTGTTSTADKIDGITFGFDVAGSTRYLVDIASGSKVDLYHLRQSSVSTNLINDHNASAITASVNSVYGTYCMSTNCATATALGSASNPVSTATYSTGQQPTFDGTKLSPQSKPHLDVRDPQNGQPGAVCDGTTDDTTALQNAINAVPNNGMLIVPPGCKLKITSEITVQNKFGFRWVFQRAADSNAAAGNIAGLYWYGGSTSNPCVFFNQVRTGTMDDFLLFTDPAGAGTGCNIGVSVDESASPTNITTNMTFRGGGVINNHQNDSFVGVQIAANAPGNVENGAFYDFGVWCSSGTPGNNSSVGFQLGPGGQPNNWKWERSPASGCGKGKYLNMWLASPVEIGNEAGGNNYTDIYVQSVFDLWVHDLNIQSDVLPIEFAGGSSGGKYYRLERVTMSGTTGNTDIKIDSGIQTFLRLRDIGWDGGGTVTHSIANNGILFVDESGSGLNASSDFCSTIEPLTAVTNSSTTCGVLGFTPTSANYSSASGTSFLFVDNNSPHRLRYHANGLGAYTPALLEANETPSGNWFWGSSKVIGWNSDTGLARDSAGVVDVGNGTQGDASGTVNAAHYKVGGSLLASSHLSDSTSLIKAATAAGGDLSGSYPNPGVAQVNGAPVPASTLHPATNSSGQFVDGRLAHISLTGQGTSGLNGQTFFTCGSAGLYRVHLALYTQTAGSSGTVQVNISYNTGYGAANLWSGTIQLNSAGNSGQATGNMPFHCGANQPVTYTATVTCSSCGSPTWGLDMVAFQDQ